MSPDIKELKQMYLENHRQRYPSLPEPARVAPAYSDKTANKLTRCIIDYIRLKGGQAERISVTGRYVDKRKRVMDVMGNEREIGSGYWLPSSMQKGSADISATIAGRSVKIEIKIGRDRQSPAQQKYQEAVERAGGTYLLIRNFSQFKLWMDNIN